MDFLFHYTSSSTCLTDILPYKRLLMNSIQKSNDPYESQLFYFTLENIPTTITDPFLCSRFRTDTNLKVRLRTRMLCFSTKKRLIEGFNLPRMWAQYGENHKGICLVIKKNEFLKENKPLIDFKSKVYYSKELINPKVDYNMFEGIKDHEKRISKIIKVLKKQIFFSKMTDWSSENEFRCINISRPEKEYCTIEKSLFGIILGCRFEKVYLPSIKEQIKEYPNEIKLYQAFFMKKIQIAENLFDGFQYPPYGKEGISL